ncbi:type II toxin-antitoxin system VapC family toxin [Nocardia stercoris]|uniref:Type II toxin-antitoxin system VapC family toxin n=1 Tax=Nocardia stercoris TaxID=2483361 RepID=A0A3M2KS46_9NOCA|nr:type II toxin-antitoxin system VapC family toxin [Nocardia stercoris]RMI28299.1 type II toxin-antitoxin system VapC family toxin [Nocardia stercoris]
MSETFTHRHILLDTSVLVDFGEIHDQLPMDCAASISAVTLAELAAGVNSSPDPIRQTQRQLQLQWVARTFEPLAFDADSAYVYGSLSLLVQRIGRKPRKRVADLQIAATAVQHALPLYTRNPDDFRGLEPLLNLVAI